jgi:class 3 adenylate cyclase
MDVGGWLRSLGLGQYETLFRASEIDADILPELTEVDLEKLGVPLGHRKRLLRAISGLTAAETLAGPSASTGAKPHDVAERRQLTVMFCDLVGSTALSVRFDPEELREEIRAYQNTVSAVVARYDGFVAKFMGDGVLAYFGYPRAHEDDAERALRSGLEIQAAVTSLETRGTERLAVRIGIATGLVIVGDLVGEGSAQEQAVVGETPNLAARLQALAEPGQLVIAGATRRLVGDMFRLRDLGRHTIGVQELTKSSDPRSVRPMYGTCPRRCCHVAEFENECTWTDPPITGGGCPKIEERRAKGADWRRRVPLSAQAEWAPPQGPARSG